MGLSQAEAEEVAQDTFLRAWQHLDRFDASRAAFSTWIYTIARRLALDLLERAEHRYRVHDGSRIAEAGEGTSAYQDAVSDGCQTHGDSQPPLMAAIATLGLDRRAQVASASRPGPVA
jgi:RNA polymerase sigma-70 factor (ECF subfamily)